MSNIASLILQRNVLQRELADLEIERDIAQRTTPGLVPGLNAQIIAKQQQINEINLQIELLSSSTASSGTVVRDDSLATVDRSSTQNPSDVEYIVNDDGRIQVAPATTSGTNAQPAVTEESVDSGTDAEVRTLTQTQGTFPGADEVSSGALLYPGIDGFDSPETYTVGGQPGFGAGNDDTPGKNSTRAEIDAIFQDGPIKAQPNVLDQYASYTYVASVYLLTKQAFQTMINSGQKNLNAAGATLLFQSGGASVQGRNPYFTNDYYIEKLELLSVIRGKGTNSAHNVAQIKMTVVEPNGITLLQNLDRAVQDYLGGVDKKRKNYQAENYLLVIRFYGYDDQGNLIRGGVPKPDGSSDPNAFVEKFYPMRINNIKYRIANKLVEYDIDATPGQYDLNVGSDRGSIPYNLELSGTTVKDVLSGPAIYSSQQQAVTRGGNSAQSQAGSNSPVAYDDEGNLLPGYALDGEENPYWLGASNGAPAKADAAPTAKKTITQGLMAALNEYQQQLYRDGIYSIPDQYNIEFVNASIESAKIKRAGTTDKGQTPMSTDQSAGAQKLGSKQSADFNSRNISAVAGTQIVQVIDKILRNSTYIEDQQIVKVNDYTQKEEPNGSPGKNVAWYKISMKAVPIGYDSKRNDYAYKITYIVSAFRLAELVSPYFQMPSYNGTHKRYAYWFTGENKAVLNYEIDFKSQYALVLSGGISQALQSSVSDANVLQRFVYKPRSAENTQGAKGRTNEAAANAADYQYNYADLCNINLTIVGDPAWLQQGEAFAAPTTNRWRWGAFLPDGTINFDSQDILFEVAFNLPTDYNLSTGLIEPGGEISAFSVNTGSNKATAQNNIFKAVKVTSEFNKGKFTQVIQGVMMKYTPEQVAVINQMTQMDVSNQALRAYSQSRLGFQNLLSGITSVPYLLSGLTTGSALNNLTPQGISTLLNNASTTVLGGQSVRNSPTATNPTSFGLSVGSTVLNSINFGQLSTPPFAGSIAPGTSATAVIPESDLYKVTDVGPSQVMTAGDDAGVPELLNREDQNLG